MRRHRATQARAGLRLLALVRATAVILAVATVAWSAGFLWFVGVIPMAPAATVETTDAIVVLTGGQLRLDTGIALLKDGRAGKLFISGVHRGVDVAQILRLAEEAPDALRCCIELGHDAADTRGNAAETAEWAARAGIRSIRLVTANYHIPRSRVEFERALPTVAIVLHPVFSDQVPVGEWWRRPGTAALLAGEYSKYVIALARGGL
ncbi:MAG: YdcF family protein [Alphaproteobacteria bacterium]|nr:YdcF family protein [Alphaproteobacteria bacterium]